MAARPRRLAAAIAGLCSWWALASGCDRGSRHGELQIVSFPRAEVLVDGRRVGARTPVQHLRVRAGDHEIRLEAAGVRFEPQRVVVRAGHPTHLYFRARDTASGEASEVVCASGREEHCWHRLDEAVRSGDTALARRLGEIYLARRSEGGYSGPVRAVLARLPASSPAAPATASP